MKQTAQVIRSVSPGYAEVMVRRTSACASAHKCGSCDHCSMMENAPEIIVVAENPNGAQPGDTVTVESATSSVLGAAVLLYVVPFVLFFALYLLGGGDVFDGRGLHRHGRYGLRTGPAGRYGAGPLPEESQPRYF